jgi:hypothetical protein
MPPHPLYDKSRDFNKDVFHNIVSLRESVDLFDELTDGNDRFSQIAARAEMRVKEGIPAGMIQRGFHYTTAIGYPFESEPFLLSRYGNGTFGVWYGSLDLETTIHETIYHMMKEELRIEGLNGRIVRERAIYLVHVHAILINLTGKEKHFPDLVSNDYSLTQQIAERLHREGHPGLLAPSARCPGTNLAAFTPLILNNPRHNCFLTYSFDPGNPTVEVERHSGEVILRHQFS